MVSFPRNSRLLELHKGRDKLTTEFMLPLAYLEQGSRESSFLVGINSGKECLHRWL